MTEGRADSEAKLAECEAALARLRGAEDLQSLRQFAEVLLDKGLWLARLERYAEAVTAYGELGSVLAGRTDEALWMLAARGDRQRARMLTRVGRHAEADQVFGDLLDRLRGIDAEEVRLLRARTMFNRVWSLEAAGREQAALGACEAFVEGLEERTLPDDPGLVVRGWWRLAWLLWQAGRRAEAVETYQAIPRRFAASEDVRVLVVVAQAMMAHAHLREGAGEPEAALEIYDDLIRRFSHHRDRPLLVEVDRALVEKSRVLFALGRLEEQLAVLDQTLVRREPDDEVGLPWLAFDTLYRRALCLHNLARYVDAARALGCFLEQARAESDAHAQFLLVDALVAWRDLADDDADQEGLLAAERELLGRATESSHPRFRTRAAQILADRMWRHTEAGDTSEARADAAELARRFDRERDPSVLVSTGRNVNRAGQILQHSHGPSPAEILNHAVSGGSAVRVLGMVARWGWTRVLGGSRAYRRDLGEAQRLFERVIQRCQVPDDPELYALAMLARSHRAGTRFALGHITAPVRYWRWLFRTGDPGVQALNAEAAHLEPNLTPRLAGVLMSKVLLLEAEGRHDERLTAQRHIAERFHDHPDAMPRLLARLARSYRTDPLAADRQASAR